jgi:hypothetical protein
MTGVKRSVVFSAAVLLRRASTAMRPLAPGLLSTTTACPRLSRRGVGDQARDDVGLPAGRDGDEHPDGLLCPDLRVSNGRRGSGDCAGDQQAEQMSRRHGRGYEGIIAGGYASRITVSDRIAGSASA